MNRKNQPPLKTPMSAPQILTALWEILSPCLKVLVPCSEGSSIRLNLLNRLEQVGSILEKAAPAVANWKEFLAEITQLTTLLEKDASVVTWNDAWTQLLSDRESVIKCTTPKDERVILQAVTSYCKQLVEKSGQDQQSMTKETASSPPTLTKPQTDQTDHTFTSFTPVPHTSAEGHVPAEGSMTTGLTEWLTSATTQKPVTTVAGRYSYIFKRTGEMWNKSILHGRVDPGTVIMGCSLNTVGADGRMTCMMDMKMPVQTSGPEIAALQQMEQKLRFNMAMNDAAVEKQDSETKRKNGSSAWEEPYPKRFSAGSRTTYRR